MSTADAIKPTAPAVYGINALDLGNRRRKQQAIGFGAVSRAMATAAAPVLQEPADCALEHEGGEAVDVRTTWWGRLRGLLAARSRSIPTIVLMPCRDIHTYGMGHSIDIAFFDERGTAIAVMRDLPPRSRFGCHDARFAVERPSAPNMPWFELGQNCFSEVISGPAAKSEQPSEAGASPQTKAAKVAPVQATQYLCVPAHTIVEPRKIRVSGAPAFQTA
ncbi:hypothetical protein [Slackia heliotrinireducens]|jgi:hypothetical protein|uniref:DUF192 domain-containing protein n=1 Tax=Slackia heliotrinireducens (strain ATCC 29202 / DSM 20476 / NCTC 11029 / RHS 1) TaxID=471855 RepID=C7N7Y8_SLAHD|nr:hypothetical protein [Slackia heliotrinireducens]ACV23023.1 hypothetical protein Shel_20090 [Slackia heliotrinireducens DSM 20476]VEH01939.1 Uncharacterised protein [Slackia heliotrinireducens]